MDNKIAEEEGQVESKGGRGNNFYDMTWRHEYTGAEGKKEDRESIAFYYWESRAEPSLRSANADIQQLGHYLNH